MLYCFYCAKEIEKCSHNIEECKGYGLRHKTDRNDNHICNGKYILPEIEQRRYYGNQY